MKTYVGITIGPIFDTIMEASTPAALWYASGLFSDLTKRLCVAIKAEEAFSDVHILSPYHGEDIRENDGVGKYHDRIFFSAEGFDEDALKKIVKKIKIDTAENFPQEFLKGAEDFFENYLQVHYIIVKETDITGSVILELSKYLDALELMKTFPKENTMNPIRRLFLGETENVNKYIKNCSMFRQITNNQFVSKGDAKGNIRSIEDIACDNGKCAKNLKKEKYYAVVQADGDGVGAYLKSLSGDDAAVSTFSENCLKYAEKASDLIGDFGGMTIYAGGDDLLFLSPVENAAGKTVFSLCSDIAKEFKKYVPGGSALSFGISIQYRKFPLYEAHQVSCKLLSDVKRNVKGKNSMAINVQKHSGQSLSIVVSNDNYHVLEQALEIGAEITNPEEKVTSVIQTMETFKGLLCILSAEDRTRTDKEAFRKAFMNLFDNPGQGAAKVYLENISEFFFEYFVNKKGSIALMPKKADKPENEKTAEEKHLYEEEKTKDAVRAMLYVLRLKKFLCEKGDEA